MEDKKIDRKKIAAEIKKILVQENLSVSDAISILKDIKDHLLITSKVQ